jgi:hypothetical protein
LANRSPFLGVALLLLGCGGSATHGPRMTSAEGGAPEVAVGGATSLPGGESSLGGSGPAPIDDYVAGAGGANEGGGGAKDDEPEDDGSGTLLCLDSRDCPGELSCTAAVELMKLACLKACTTDDTCFPTQRCIGSQDVPASCFPTCEWPWDCSYQFDCVLPKNRTEYVCVPSQWASSVITSAP